jgi:hypothetical protein
MDWTHVDMDRLYELYEQHFDEVRSAVISANRSHGSSQPEKTWMELLDRNEFEKLLKNPTDEPKIVNRWVKRIIRDFENEFPNLRVA